MNGDFLTRLRRPVGLDLGDRSAGIAVSIVSEVMPQLNDRDGRAMSQAVCLRVFFR